MTPPVLGGPDLPGRAACGLAVRLATPADLPQVRALVNAAYRGDQGMTGWTHEMAWVGGPRISVQQLAELSSQSGAWLLVGRQRGPICACIHLHQREYEVEIGLLAVAPAEQGRGLGSCMLDYAERCAGRALLCRRVAIAVLAPRAELIAFYERRGYKRVSTETPYPIHLQVGTPKIAGLGVIRMKKRLPVSH